MNKNEILNVKKMIERIIYTATRELWGSQLTFTIKNILNKYTEFVKENVETTDLYVEIQESWFDYNFADADFEDCFVKVKK